MDVSRAYVSTSMLQSSSRFLKQLTDEASITWAGSLFHTFTTLRLNKNIFSVVICFYSPSASICVLSKHAHQDDERTCVKRWKWGRLNVKSLAKMNQEVDCRETVTRIEKKYGLWDFQRRARGWSGKSDNRWKASAARSWRLSPSDAAVCVRENYIVYIH